MKLILARHGETDWTAAGRYQGQSDPPLSSHGEVQANLLAARLVSANGMIIISSPLLRAFNTAKAIADRLRCSVAADDRLIELGYGQWEGLQQAEIKMRWPELLRSWKRTPDQVRFPDGESLHDLQRRVRSFLASMATEVGAGPCKTVLAVTHDGVIRLAALELRNQPLSKFRELRVETASMTSCTRQNGQFIVESLSDVAHLRSLS
jgi:probable phosphoglycerate mutase